MACQAAGAKSRASAECPRGQHEVGLESGFAQTSNVFKAKNWKIADKGVRVRALTLNKTVIMWRVLKRWANCDKGF